MHGQIRLLWQLQELDNKKSKVLAQREKVKSDDVRQLWLEIQLLTQRLEADQEKLRCIELVCARQESDLTNINKNYKYMENMLYSGNITNLKEIDQLKAKYDATGKDILQRENEIFSSLEYCEQLTAKIRKDEKNLMDKKKQHLNRQKEVAEETNKLAIELQSLEQQYNSIVALVDQQLLQQYKLLRRKLLAPVARVENGICGGCRISIPTSQTMSLVTELSYCDNCGRILMSE